MAQRLDSAETRLDAILAANRGGDGSLGAEATAVAIVASKYRRRARPTQLSDRGYPAEEFDRAYDLEWPASTDSPSANNAYQSPQFRTYTLRLTVGYLHGDLALEYVHLQPSSAETKAHAALRPYTRAQNDADEIKQALEFPALYQVTGEDPFIASVTRLGETRVDPIGPGRLLATTLFAVEISWARGAWNPAT